MDMCNFARWCLFGLTINSDSYLEHQQLPGLLCQIVSVYCAVEMVFVLNTGG